MRDKKEKEMMKAKANLLHMFSQYGGPAGFHIERTLFCSVSGRGSGLSRVLAIYIIDPQVTANKLYLEVQNISILVAKALGLQFRNDRDFRVIMSSGYDADMLMESLSFALYGESGKIRYEYMF